MGPRILLVDDDHAARRTLAAMLQRLGYYVLEAEDGNEALATISYTKPELIISDFKMPGMNGSTLFLRLQERSDLALIPFILISGFIDHWPAELAHKMPVAVLQKPVTFDRLSTEITKALKNARQAAARAGATAEVAR